MTPLLIGYDPAAGVDQTVIARLRAVEGGTAFEVIELKRRAEEPMRPVLERLNTKLNLELARWGSAWMSMHWPHDNSGPVLQVHPLGSVYKPMAAARPTSRRPRQRSANMRKHARIVRSRMTPNEQRKRAASWERLKRTFAKAGIVNPNASKFSKGMFT